MTIKTINLPILTTEPHPVMTVPVRENRKYKVGLVQINNSFANQNYLPLSIGFLHAYAQKYAKNFNDFEFVNPIYKRLPLAQAVSQLDGVDIACFSTYVWNFNLSCKIAQKLKEKNPNTFILFGGCHIPDNEEKGLKEFLYKYPFVDLVITGEGERAFSAFLEKFHDRDWQNVPSTAYLDDNKQYFRTKVAERIEDLNEIPSPYLNGYFDSIAFQNPDENWIGLFETNRGCPFKCTFCFAGDTIALTANRVFRFDRENVQTENLMCSCGSTHELKRGQEERSLIQTGNKKCLSFEFYNGLSLTVTPDHKIYCADNDNIVMKQAQDISANDWVVTQIGQNAVKNEMPLCTDNPKNLNGVIPKTFNTDLAWLTGLLIGDGNIRKQGTSVRFVAAPDIEQKIKHISENIFEITPRSYDIGNTDKVRHVEIFSKLIVNMFRSIGIGSGFEKLRVPEIVMRSPSIVVRAFLEGLWAADGYKPKNAEHQYLTTVSSQLAHECASLIHWIGDIAAIKHIDSAKYKPNVSYNVQSVFRVEWHGRENMYRENTRGTCGFPNQVPLSYGISRSLKRISPTHGGRTRGVVSRYRLKQFDAHHPLIRDDVIYTQVKTITKTEKIPVFDMMNQPRNIVVANGVMASNCDWGTGEKNRMSNYDLDGRIFSEIEWFSKNKISFVYCCDANFGMYKRDLDIARKFAELKSGYGYPERFSVQNTKNSTELSYQIQKVLVDSGLDKGVLLAFQSIHEPTLEAIERKNIKLSTFFELQRRFTSEGVTTFSDIILGLPLETYETFVHGVETLICSGQHNRIQFNNLSILPNAPIVEDMSKFGLDIVESKIINIHGSLAETEEIEETQLMVVGNYALPRDRWVEARSFGYMTSLLHFDKLLQIPNVIMNTIYGVKYKDIIQSFLDADSNQYPVIAKVSEAFRDQARNMQRGGAEYCESKEWLNIWWPADELAYIHLSTQGQLDAFYDEAKNILLSLVADKEDVREVLDEAMLLNRTLLKQPCINQDIELSLKYNVYQTYRENILSSKSTLKQGQFIHHINRSDKTWVSWEQWCQEVVWYGNKKGDYYYRCSV